MKYCFAALLLFLIAHTLVPVSAQDDLDSQCVVTQTAIISGKTIVQEFTPTFYPAFETLNSTIQVTTSISVVIGSSTDVQVFTHDIGPWGIGWAVPTAKSGDSVLSEPSYLPGQSFSFAAQSTASGSSSGNLPPEVTTTDGSFSTIPSPSNVISTPSTNFVSITSPSVGSSTGLSLSSLSSWDNSLGQTPSSTASIESGHSGVISVSLPDSTFSSRPSIGPKVSSIGSSFSDLSSVVLTGSAFGSAITPSSTPTGSMSESLSNNNTPTISIVSNPSNFTSFSSTTTSVTGPAESHLSSLLSIIPAGSSTGTSTLNTTPEAFSTETSSNSFFQDTFTGSSASKSLNSNSGSSGSTIGSTEILPTQSGNPSPSISSISSNAASGATIGISTVSSIGPIETPASSASSFSSTTLSNTPTAESSPDASNSLTLSPPSGSSDLSLSTTAIASATNPTDSTFSNSVGILLTGSSTGNSPPGTESEIPLPGSISSSPSNITPTGGPGSDPSDSSSPVQTGRSSSSIPSKSVESPVEASTILSSVTLETKSSITSPNSQNPTKSSPESTTTTDSTAISLAPTGEAPSETSSHSSGLVTVGSNAITGTITSVPSGFTATTLDGTTFSRNAWYTTTGKDHHTTILPLIVGGGGRGILFWNLPEIPHIDFQFPGFPTFYFPCIKIFGVSVGDCPDPPAREDGEGSEDPPKTETSSSDECTTSSTVSECEVRCVSSTSSSCDSYTTTCSQTSTGCSVTGRTSTITSSDACLATPAQNIAQATATLCNGGCLPLGPAGSAIPPRSTAESTPDPDFRKRFIAGRITANPLLNQRRADPSPIPSLGGCSLPSSAPLTLPGWPGAYADMLNHDQFGQMAATFSDIPRYDRATYDNCVFTTVRLNAVDFANAPAWQDASEKQWPENNDISLDHAYEKQWIKQFFNSIIGTTNIGNSLTCGETNQYFFPSTPGQSGSQPCYYNLMQAVWDGLASNENHDFIAMSKYLNAESKGRFFNPRGFVEGFVHDPAWEIPADFSNWRWKSKPNDPQSQRMPYSAADVLRTMLFKFEPVLYGVLEMKSAEMQGFIDKTNNRIYDQLENLGVLIARNPSNMFGSLLAYQTKFPHGFAGAYRNWMTTEVLPKINAPSIYLTSLWYDRIWKDLGIAMNMPGVYLDAHGNHPGQYYQEWLQFYNVVAEHNKHYGTDQAGVYTWEYTFAFSWDTSQVTKRNSDILARQNGFCAMNPLSMESSSGSASSTPETSSVETTFGPVTGQPPSTTITVLPVPLPSSTITVVPIPSPTGPRIEYNVTCNAHTEPFISITYDEVVDFASKKGCNPDNFVNAVVDPQSYFLVENNKNITGTFKWYDDQTRCWPRTDDRLAVADCMTWFKEAMLGCDTSWGSSVVWDSEKGCLYIELYATAPAS